MRYLSLKSLLPDTTGYMTYEGSTTHPGCWETAVWLILNKPIYITAREVNIIPRFDNSLPNFCPNGSSFFFYLSKFAIRLESLACHAITIESPESSDRSDKARRIVLSIRSDQSTRISHYLTIYCFCVISYTS